MDTQASSSYNLFFHKIYCQVTNCSCSLGVCLSLQHLCLKYKLQDLSINVLFMSYDVAKLLHSLIL